MADAAGRLVPGVPARVRDTHAGLSRGPHSGALVKVGGALCRGDSPLGPATGRLRLLEGDASAEPCRAPVPVLCRSPGGDASAEPCPNPIPWRADVLSGRAFVRCPWRLSPPPALPGRGAAREPLALHRRGIPRPSTDAQFRPLDGDASRASGCGVWSEGWAPSCGAGGPRLRRSPSTGLKALRRSGALTRAQGPELDPVPEPVDGSMGKR